MREVSDYDNALRGSYEETGSISNVDLYCKMLKKRDGMGKQTLIGEDSLSLSDDNNYDDDNNNSNNNNDNNVKLTKIEKGIGCDYDNMQSRQMNGNREDSIKPVSPDPCQMTAEGVASLTAPLKRNLAITLPSYLIQVCISIHAPIRVYKFIFRPYESTEMVMWVHNFVCWRLSH
jgi:hypothetical protein